MLGIMVCLYGKCTTYSFEDQIRACLTRQRTRLDCQP